jgi:phage pi2 protein 07
MNKGRLMEEPKSTIEVAAMFGCDARTVRLYAEAHGLKYIGSGQGKRWLFYAKDIEDFQNREKPGRRWPSKDIKKKKKK